MLFAPVDRAHPCAQPLFRLFLLIPHFNCVINKATHRNIPKSEKNNSQRHYITASRPFHWRMYSQQKKHTQNIDSSVKISISMNSCRAKCTKHPNMSRESIHKRRISLISSMRLRNENPLNTFGRMSGSLACSARDVGTPSAAR